MRERPNSNTENTLEGQYPSIGKGQGIRMKVHSVIDKTFSHKNLELAWEKVKMNRGSAGIDEGTVAKFEEGKDFYLDLLHYRLGEDTYRPKAVKRIKIAKSEAILRKLGIFTVMDRVVVHALAQRMERIFEPKVFAWLDK